MSDIYYNILSIKMEDFVSICASQSIELNPPPTTETFYLTIEGILDGSDSKSTEEVKIEWSRFPFQPDEFYDEFFYVYAIDQYLTD